MSTSTDVSIIIAVLGVILLYFGKVIADTKVEQYDKLGFYITGLVFTSVFIILPTLAVGYLIGKIVISDRMFIGLQLLSMVLLSLNVRAHYYLRKHGLLKWFKKGIATKIEKIRSGDSWTGKLIKKYEKRGGRMDYVNLNVAAYYKVPIEWFGNSVALFMFSITTLFSTASILATSSITMFIYSSILTFFILTLIALAYGFGNAYYPPSKILLENGQVIEGRILKFGKMIYCLRENKKFFVNSDKVLYVEQSLLKSKEDDI